MMITINYDLGNFQESVDHAIALLHENRILDRIWSLDHTVWQPEPQEITNRLGWLWIAEKMLEEVPVITDFADELVSAGFTNAVLLGMGGSSLAPEVFREVFGIRDGYLNLWVLDSTDPKPILEINNNLDLSKTLFIVATKSGGTVETLSLFKYFYNQIIGMTGKDQGGNHFVAITDPGSTLEKTAKRLNFRAIFLNDPNIGGRYSALSHFGLVPAALIGVDITSILDRAIGMSKQNKFGGELGTALAILATKGRDKLTFTMSKEIESFGDWVEQLIAESTGKKGKGILPVVGEELTRSEYYGNDRLFIFIQFPEDTNSINNLVELKGERHPIIQIEIQDKYDLGGQFFLWELATAVACYFMQINPFDQPNVESAKILARRMVAEYSNTGSLPLGNSALLTQEVLHNFLADSKPGDYISVQAFIPPTIENEIVLQRFRLHLRDRYKLATTLGFGPRFLHSTGQLHKGDAGNGIYIQFTSDTKEDVAIPDEPGKPDTSMTFNTLKISQALGDGLALSDAGRRFIRFHLSSDVEESLQQLY